MRGSPTFTYTLPWTPTVNAKYRWSTSWTFRGCHWFRKQCHASQWSHYIAFFIHGGNAFWAQTVLTQVCATRIGVIELFQCLESSSTTYQWKSHPDMLHIWCQSVFERCSYKLQCSTRRKELHAGWGVDYSDVFSMVAKCRTVRTTLALVAKNGWKYMLLNIKAASLKAPLNQSFSQNDQKIWNSENEMDWSFFTWKPLSLDTSRKTLAPSYAWVSIIERSFQFFHRVITIHQDR